MHTEAKFRIFLLTILALLIMEGTAELKDNYSFSVEPYKILLISAVGTRSHKNFYMGVVKALAERGHQVTVVTTFKENTNIPNVRDITIDGPDLTWILKDPFKYGINSLHIDLMKKPAIYCSQNLAATEVQNLKNETFDLIILSPWNCNDCFFSLVHHFKVPYIFISPFSLFGGMHNTAGNIYFDSLVPNPMLDQSSPPSYVDRLKSSVSNFIYEVILRVYTLPRMRRFCDEAGLCPDDMPPIKDFYGKNSLVIINSIKTLQSPPQPWMPHVVHAGGIHCRPAKEIQQDLEDWLQDSNKEGFIYFSLGSVVTPSNMPQEYRNIFLEVFGSLKCKVLWKWDEEIIEGLPSNVKLSKWFPQQDILGHPNIRLFITHGGLLSLQEATYHNVPILGMPLFTDQFHNVRESLQQGWGEQLRWNDLSKDLLRSKILSIVKNKKMKKNVERRSAIMRDSLTKPSDEVTYWIEYVIRYDGAEHIVSTINKLYIWELYNIDVWALLLLVCLVFFIICTLFVKKIFTSLCSRKSKTD